MAGREDEPAPIQESTPTELGKRTYIAVRPSDDPLSIESIRGPFERLHRLRSASATSSWVRRLFASAPAPPTIECLLISAASASAVDYYFGIDDGHELDVLERALRGLFPDSYELERTTLDLTTSIDAAVETSAETVGDDDEWFVAGVEYQGATERRNDWQTQLTPFRTFHAEGESHVPLTAIVQTMADMPVSLVYQVLLRPKPDWTAAARLRRRRLEEGRDTRAARFGEALVQVLFPTAYDEERSTDETSPVRSEQRRLEELDGKGTRRSFAINARVAALTREQPAAAKHAVDDLVTAFSAVGRTSYELEGVVRTDDELHTGTCPPGSRVLRAIRQRTFRPPNYERSITQLPWTANTSQGIVADASEAPNFCLLGGPALTATGTRAVATTPGERTALPRPPDEQLDAYRGAGLTLGHAQTQDDRTSDDNIVLPPSLQRLHVGWFGKTGSGKSTSVTTAILDNHTATAGADLLIDPKGDGMAIEYLRSHYARFGTLDNVYYFDCGSVLPAFSFFDIRAELEAGVSRTTAVEDVVDHYIEILMQVMGRERFEQAVRSPDVIRYLLKAQFDPVHGSDALSHRQLHEAARRMHERQTAPAVSDPDLERMLGGVVANHQRSFDEIMQGVANRLEKIPVDRRLASVFNHVPDSERDDPVFDLADLLDEDVVVILDMGELRSEAQRVLTLVVLSNLWTALRRRSRRGSNDAEHPLVNLYLEEAASVAVSDLLGDLLAQSRGFDCSVTLSMQFPAQLRRADERAYDELLNNISTFVTGNVPVDRRLARRLATDDMDPETVGNRLRALRRGQWLVRLPAPFDEPEPRPFLAGSATPPAGHPASAQSMDRREEWAFADARIDMQARTRSAYGLGFDMPHAADQTASESGSESVAVDRDGEPIEEADERLMRVDSALPHTKRLPASVVYDAAIHALRCADCDNRYDPSATGLKRAVDCCHDLSTVDRNDIPICDLNLKLTPEERAATGWTDRQLCFLQAVYNAQQLRYDAAFEYDLVWDSMLRLQEYVGIESAAVDELLDTDLLRHDTDHPHRLYTVTAAGRKTLGESYRQGVDYGHGKGDLEESSQHVFAVEVARQYLESEYAHNADSPVIDVHPYYDIDENRRLDLAGLDADDEVVVTVEIERINHDVHEAVPADYDKMAACDPEEAIWVVMTRDGGHQVLAVLNDPPDDEPRIEKTYSQNTPPQQFRIDTPGLTSIYPVELLRESVSD
ncbi:ATP-binding protein [Halococcus sp. AFM35]|uniref:ATP-binding protein n=1 Tax=Halococcus sp. AFM35 TaxID=3421653 RepID=UPI003EBC4A82